MSHSAPAAREKQHSVRKALLLGCVVALLGAACGQRGPLYLPQPEPRPESQPVPRTAAADDMQSEARKSEEDSAAEKDAEEDEDNE